MTFAKSFIATAMAVAVAVVGAAHAAVSPEQANQLGTSLTAIGAEKAANADGTIPEYTGGLTAINSADPFANEKPRLVITAQNLAQHKDKLSATTQQLFERYPTFRMDVYPTHRTVALPKAIEENALKNALNAKTIKGGQSMENALPGVPFPIPQDGYQAMWNHLTRYMGASYQLEFESWNIDASGAAALSAGAKVFTEYPLYAPERISSGVPLAPNELYYQVKVNYTKPNRRAGEAFIVKDSIDPLVQPRRAWQYLSGQRRVKLAPSLSYDTPNPSTNGNTTFDDVFLFNGAMDRFDFKLVGKKEMYVPYNAYKLISHKQVPDIATPQYLNPEMLRWELHRVWVVEATLQPGKRHIYSKRRFYLDEDSWTILASDQYDARDQLYRGGFSFLVYKPEQKAPNADFSLYYDFVSGAYNLSVFYGAGSFKFTPQLSKAQWAPDALAGSGIR